MRNTMFKYKHPHTVWEDIKADIEKNIANNTFKVGEKVPSINQISQDYLVSCNTAVKVLESLRNDGTILKKRGVGYFVMPLSKEKLLKKQKNELGKKVIQLSQMAKGIGLSKEELKELVVDRIERFEWD